MNPSMKNAKQGAETSIYVATSPDLEGVTGRYFTNKRERKSSEESYNKEKQERLWKLSEKLTQITFSLD